MANAAPDPERRDTYLNEERLWLGIANDIDAGEQVMRAPETPEQQGHDPEK